MKKLYLIDGSSYIYRAFYALGRLTNSKGMPTQAVYGFGQMLQKVIRDKTPDYLCVVFDAPAPSFRHEMYEAYKATRQRMPEDLAVQVPFIKDLVKYHGVLQIEKEGYEADDLIASLVRWAVAQDVEVVIVSADKDLHQLIEDTRVLQWDPQRNKVFTEEGVKERFGVMPLQIRDYLALTGDSSDNVPGVKGVGDKTAKQVLQKWGSLDSIYANLDEVSPESLKKKLKQSKEEAYLSLKLVTLRDDLPVSLHLQDFEPSPPLRKELIGFYEELEFKRLLEAVQETSEGIEDSRPPAVSDSRLCSRVIRGVDDLSELVCLLEKQEEISVHLEVTPHNPAQGKLLGMALSCEDHIAYSIPVGHGSPQLEIRLEEAEVLRALEPVLSSRKPLKLGQNIKETCVVLRERGVQLNGIGFDTMLASYLLDPGRNTHDLARIAQEYLGEKAATRPGLVEKDRANVSAEQPGVKDVMELACSETDIVRRLAPVLKEKLRNESLEDLYFSIELPLLEVLADMEHRGILVDSGKLQSVSAELEKTLDEKASVIYELAKEEFNIQSPKQLAYILFDKLGLRVIKKTKSGPSTDISVLEELALEHPIAEQVLAYRSIAKLKGTYADALPKLVNPETGRIHTSYNQAVTATGRLSSSDPNLQNIPVRAEEGRRIRSAFVAPQGQLLVSFDYSQIELRILAHYSRDEHLLEAFRSGADVHLLTAAEMLNVPRHEVTPEMRRQAKTINFGIIYGMGPFGLAQRLHISTKMAKAAIDQYFNRYHGVKRFIESTVESVRKSGYSVSLLGRKRAIPELQSRNYTIRQQGERQAVNTPIQGTAADLIKKAMIDVDMVLKEHGLKAGMVLQVHDELVFEVPEIEFDEARQVIKQTMEAVWPLEVPLKVDMGWGRNWTEAHS